MGGGGAEYRRHMTDALGNGYGKAESGKLPSRRAVHEDGIESKTGVPFRTLAGGY